jgi:tripartite-type tricarboxylate transporter receptor subunit TctC
MKNFKKCIGALAVLISVSCAAAGAAAQSGAYPSRPIKLIITFAAGGPGDIIGRLLAEKVGAELGQTIIVDNRAGGSSVIGTQAVARSEPDGYTILQLTGANVIVAHLQSNLPYEFEKDFTPVVGVGSVPLVLAVPGKSNIHSIADLIAASQSMSGGLNYASGGNGSLGHLAGAHLVRELKIKATHVAYRGNSPALQDLIGDRVQLLFASTIEALQLAEAGEIRLLGVTSDQRLPGLPGVPAMKELGLGSIDPRTWYGYLVPSKTPAAIVDRLYVAFSKALAKPDVQERLQALNFTTKLADGPEFGRFMQAESVRWQKVIQENGIRGENQ